MQKLKLPGYPFRFREKNGKPLIYDDLRRRWIVLTPEEWVRQHVIRFLVTEKQFPPSLIAIEKKVLINGLSQRFDLLVFDRHGKPLLIAEFKSPDVDIDQIAFDQALRYNTALLAPFFLVSNGMVHFICRIDFVNHQTRYLTEIPAFSEILNLKS